MGFLLIEPEKPPFCSGWLTSELPRSTCLQPVLLELQSPVTMPGFSMDAVDLDWGCHACRASGLIEPSRQPQCLWFVNGTN